MPTLADLLTYGRVTDSFFAGIGDVDSDPLNLPDIVDVAGRATFTPNLASGEVLLFSSVPAVYLPMPKVATYDTSGVLSLNGAEHVVLEATDNPFASRLGWTWTVAFSGLTVNGISITRNGFSFRLPASLNPVDLTRLTPVTSTNGTAVVQGPPGTSGTGIILRGTFTGTGSGVLPSGYSSAQNGYTFRVHSADYSYDEVWVWVWTGAAGSWVDVGRWLSFPIDDSTTAPDSTWSSSKISTTVPAGGGGTGTGGGNVYQIRQDLTTLTWPLRATVTSSPADYVEWVGTDFPPTGNGYALTGVDSFEGVIG